MKTLRILLAALGITGVLLCTTLAQSEVVLTHNVPQVQRSSNFSTNVGTNPAFSVPPGWGGQNRFNLTYSERQDGGGWVGLEEVTANSSTSFDIVDFGSFSRQLSAVIIEGMGSRWDYADPVGTFESWTDWTVQLVWTEVEDPPNAIEPTNITYTVTRPICPGNRVRVRVNTGSFTPDTGLVAILEDGRHLEAPKYFTAPGANINFQASNSTYQLLVATWPSFIWISEPIETDCTYEIQLPLIIKN